MKTGIHPKYFDLTEIRCSCGNVVIAGSTRDKLKTELCSKCHPFYTGQQKLVDTAGRVDKFTAKRHKAEAMKVEKAEKAESKKKKPESYKEKEVPAEVLERAMEKGSQGKWGGPIGDAPAVELAKEEAAEVTKAEEGKKKAVKKPAAKKAKK